MTGLCPTCGRPAEIRAGVRLPPLKARIFDTIKMAGDIGVSSRELLHKIYNGPRLPTIATIRAHVVQINDLLEETDFTIISERGRSPVWMLVRRRPWRKAAALKATVKAVRP